MPFSKTHPILRSIFSVTLLIGFAKLISLLKEMLVASEVGISADLDAFILANVMISFIILVIHRPLSSTIIPELIKIDPTDKKSQSEYFSSVFWIGLLFVIGLFCIVYLLKSVYIGYASESRSMNLNTVNLISINFLQLTPYIIFTYFSWMFMGVLNAYKKNILVSLEPMFISVAIILTFLSLSRDSPIQNLIIGLNIGALILAVCCYIGVSRLGISLQLAIKIKNNIRVTFLQFLPFILSTALTSMNSIIDVSMASMYGEGASSSLSYATKAYSLMTFIPSTVINIIFLPYFSKLVTEQRHTLIFKHLGKSAFYITILSVILVVIIGYNSYSLISVLFERGDFNTEDTKIVSQILLFYMMGFLFNILNILGLRVILAYQKNHFLLLISATGILLNIVFNKLFITIYGLKGIALSTSCVYLFVLIVIASIILRMRKSFRNSSKLIG